MDEFVESVEMSRSIQTGINNEKILELVNILGGIHKIINDNKDNLSNEQITQINNILNYDIKTDILSDNNKTIIYYNPNKMDDIKHIGYSFHLNNTWINKLCGKSIQKIIETLLWNKFIVIYFCIALISYFVCIFMNITTLFVIWLLISLVLIPFILTLMSALLLANV